MSPRPFRLRKISDPPVISGFKPYGNRKNANKTESIFLFLEEYEALRSCDYELLNQQQASVLMAVSRPTFTRIYSRARQKIAEALVQGKQIIIEGGKIYFDSGWYFCKSCGCYFNNPDKQEELKECPLCRSTNFENYQSDPEKTEDTLTRCMDICICPSCGFETPHRFGCPCKDEICPECGTNMVRKGAPRLRNF